MLIIISLKMCSSSSAEKYFIIVPIYKFLLSNNTVQFPSVYIPRVQKYSQFSWVSQNCMGCNFWYYVIWMGGSWINLLRMNNFSRECQTRYLDGQCSLNPYPPKVCNFQGKIHGSGRSLTLATHSSLVSSLPLFLSARTCCSNRCFSSNGNVSYDSRYLQYES